MVASTPTVASKAPEAPKVPEGWTALWDADEQDWYFYNPKTKTAQWESPNPTSTRRRCGLRRFLPACFFPSIDPSESVATGRAGKAPALPSEATLQAIDKVDRSFNDEEIAMVLQQEEFSQDLSRRNHTFDQDWIDTADFNEAGPSTRAPQPQPQLASPVDTQDTQDKNSVTQPPHQPPSGTSNKQQDLPAVCLQRECGICMDDDDGNAEWTWLQCTHQFHTSCVEGWLKKANRCPVCRTEFN